MVMVRTEDCIEGLRRFLESDGKADLTIQAYVSDLRMFLTELSRPEIDLGHLDHNAAVWLNRYRKIIAPKTTLRRLTSMRNFGLAFGMEVLKNYKPPKAMQQKPHPLPGGLADLEKLLAVARVDEHKYIVALTGLCGLRIAEARMIGPQHFDFRYRKLRFIGKGGREREVPLTNRAWSILGMPAMEAAIEGKVQLITCSDKAARSTITTLGKRAGISRPISSHDLRATFATETYRRSKDIRAVQLLLGHGSVAQTQLYIEVNDDELRDAASFAEDIVLDDDVWLPDDDI